MKRTSTLLAISSGKGGVGKSVVAVNLAETLAREGRRVALLDVDFGQGACAVLTNERPPASVLDHALRTATEAEVLHRTSEGLTLVQAVSEAGAADRHQAALYETLDRLLADLRRRFDVVVIDTPAGVDGPVRWALDRADLGVLVVAGEPTAVADAYRLAKLVWAADPAYPLATVVNFADTEEEAESVAERFGLVTEHFTGRRPSYLGWVPFSSDIRQSVHAQAPAVRRAGPVRDAFTKLSRTLQEGRLAPSEAVGVRS